MTTLRTRQTPESWAPSSWKTKVAAQSPEYPDAEHLDRVVGSLSTLPPLVSSWEIERLRDRLADAAQGRRFVLQGGDCAESFAECNPAAIANKLKILLQMSLVLVDGLKLPVVRIGRIAGQYAKPRSSTTETRGDQTLTSYFGDLINGSEFDPSVRTPDPERLLLAYYHASMTLNFIRALIDGGFADLHHPEYWDLDFLGKAGMTPEQRADYTRRVGALANSVQVMEIIAGRTIDKISSVEFYTSHEGLSLPYESAVTRTVPRRTGYYNLGCHMPWIGERTRSLDGAHVEYFRGIRNPVGVKIGPKTKPEDLLRLARIIDPDREAGRMVIIGRFGAENVRRVLPNLVESMGETGRLPVWMSDPMHGNTTSTKSGIKTRHYDAILEELLTSIDIHEQSGSFLGGVHFELTAENVTECIGGASGVTEDDLTTRYETLCDPRLNYEQAMELVFAIARRLEAQP